MSNETEPQETILKMQWADYASKNLQLRIAKFRKINQYIELEPRTKAVQFLRGVGSRACFVLPAFYAQLGSRMPIDKLDAPYWQRVQAASIEFSSLQTMSLACRAIFDEGRKGMTGKEFARLSCEVLSSVAEYWAEESGQPIVDATSALWLLRRVFESCARPKKSLLEASSLLERRIGLLKYHADRQAAHITLEPYLFDALDLIHVVAAIAVIGAMIVDFDDKTRGSDYFNSIDDAAWQAAKVTFPNLAGGRLFSNFDIHSQARIYWKLKEFDGLDMLLNQLPTAIGYWDSTNESTS